jgi:hypothetical protein
MVGGLASLGAGVPMWIVGQVKMRNAAGGETTSPAAAMAIPLSDHAVLDVELGARPTVGYRLSW